ncbi:MAG TPA: hypothetical protein VNE16_03050, partial [Vicinamibacterales bacterium]|nr:hypothetical protein [Vicinamibacterales bacterium]
MADQSPFPELPRDPEALLTYLRTFDPTRDYRGRKAVPDALAKAAPRRKLTPAEVEVVGHFARAYRRRSPALGRHAEAVVAMALTRWR